MADPHPVEALLAHTFADPSLLAEALTHASFKNEMAGVPRDYERLEFLGDAVFELSVSELLFRRLPDAGEGRLTRLRAELVRAETLAEVARRLGLGAHLLMGKGEEASGGRQRGSILADVLEALVAAVYLDGGFEVALALVERLLSGSLDEALARATVKDPKSRLQEWAQRHHKITPRYSLVGQGGPEHEARFEVRVDLGALPGQSGRGRSKKAAEQAAAAETLALLLGEAAAAESPLQAPAEPTLSEPAPSTPETAEDDP